MSKAAKQPSKPEGRHGKIAPENMRRQLVASRKQFAEWDEAAREQGVPWGEWARGILDRAASIAAKLRSK